MNCDYRWILRACCGDAWFKPHMYEWLKNVEILIPYFFIEMVDSNNTIIVVNLHSIRKVETENYF